MIAERRALVLAGPPGAGKTTVARRVAELRQGQALDLDQLVEARTGQTPAQLIRIAGEPRLRQEEALALEAVELDDRDVMSLGGGTLTHAPSRHQARARGPLVGLVAGPSTLALRLAADATDRPLSPPDAAAIERLLADRAATYAATDATVDAEAAPDAVARAIVEQAGVARVLIVPLGARRTRLVAGSDIAVTAAAGAVAALAPERPVVIVTDAGAPQADAIARSIEQLGPSIRVATSGGEPAKSWAVLGDALDRALAAGAGRQSVVVGIGGGAVCDLAGMIAGLLGRGAPLVLVPTTVLAQADAAVGGKCAVDVGPNKNLVGLFHPAAEVIVDVALTETQPAADRSAGIAEILKAGIIGDAPLFHQVAARGAIDLQAMVRAIRLKAEIVAADPEEKGLRKVLNLGHTLGHALEAASGMTLRHGHAVAIGVAAAARVSAARGLAAEDTVHTIEQALEACGLPTRAPAELLARSAAHLTHDKKGTRDHVDLVLVRQIGEVSIHRLSWIDAATELLRAGGGE